MQSKAKAPVKIGGKMIQPGEGIDPAKISPKRLDRLAAKGRVEAAPMDRADAAGRPALAPPKDKAE